MRIGKSLISQLNHRIRHVSFIPTGISMNALMAVVVLTGTAHSVSAQDALVDPGKYRSRVVRSAYVAPETSRQVQNQRAVFTIPEEWSTLYSGMSRRKALELLGPPRWEEKTVALNFLMYQTNSIMAAGVLVFNGDQLSSWRTPNEPLIAN